AEDVGPGDWTSVWTIPEEAQGEARIVAKEPVVVAGLEVAAAVFRAVDPALRLRQLASDGDEVFPEGTLLEIRGPFRSILTAERVALNFLGRLSGIATLTRAFVRAVEGTGATIVDTRKTTPGWRHLEKEAVRAGGGTNHRMGLYDMILIKDNHIAAAGGIAAVLEAVRRRNHRELPVELEVASLEQLEEALITPPERILLDNMSVADMGQAVRRVAQLGQGRPLLEASGNVNLDSVRGIAEAGVDLISVGALTHSAPAADLSLRVGL
ncbi:MAG: carboxylating nicotinate-nucleotide diphosphorylase, partial [Gemmatimonadales bacterium]